MFIVASVFPSSFHSYCLQRVEEMSSVGEKNIAASINKLSLTSGISTCANCSKDISNPNICNKCKAAVYCNAACKKKHRSKHKEACERRVAEMHEEELEREKRAAELHDEKLLKQPPPKEDCPICMLLLPSFDAGSRYRSCCGKIICSGCIYAVEKRDGGVGLCPFCRTPAPTSGEESIDMFKKRVEVNDAEAMLWLGICYSEGGHGLLQNHAKALERWHQAAELGSAVAYYSIGGAYYDGSGVERDEKKAKHYMELAAMGGVVIARHNLGAFEGQAGNLDWAVKHLMIAAGFGYNNSLEVIKQIFMNGDATKDNYAKALQVYQAYLVEIKSPQRDEAAAFDENYKYY